MNERQLRKRLIRLAHQHPELRAEILPLVTRQGALRPPWVKKPRDIPPYVKRVEVFRSHDDGTKVEVEGTRGWGDVYGSVWAREFLREQGFEQGPGDYWVRRASRVAHQRPDLRPHLLPLLKRAAGNSYVEEVPAIEGWRNAGVVASTFFVEIKVIPRETAHALALELVKEAKRTLRPKNRDHVVIANTVDWTEVEFGFMAAEEDEGSEAMFEEYLKRYDSDYMRQLGKFWDSFARKHDL